MINHNNKDAYVFVPHNLDVEYIKGFMNEPKDKDADKIHYFINVILRRHFYDKSAFQGYVNLSQDILKKMLTSKRLYPILKALEDAGIIEINKSYEVGVNSKSYRLTQKYREAKIKRVSITDKPLLKKLKNVNREQRLRLLKTPAFANIHRSILEVYFPYEEALNLIDKLAIKENWSLHKYNSYLIQIEDISIINKTNSNFITDVNNRLHHNYTSLPNSLLELCSWRNGEALYNIDASNCHPFLFNKIILEMFGVTYEDIPELPADVQQYIKLTSNGTFYEYIMKYLNIPLSKRKEYKIEFFSKVFYTKRNTKELDIFKSLFPNVWEVLVKCKSKNYKDLANQLMKIESKVFVKRVPKKLYEIDKNINLISKHDSIICKEKHIEMVKNIIIEELTYLVGIVPTIKTELITR